MVYRNRRYRPALSAGRCHRMVADAGACRRQHGAVEPRSLGQRLVRGTQLRWRRRGGYEQGSPPQSIDECDQHLHGADAWRHALWRGGQCQWHGVGIGVLRQCLGATHPVCSPSQRCRCRTQYAQGRQSGRIGITHHGGTHAKYEHAGGSQLPYRPTSHDAGMDRISHPHGQR